MVVPVVAGIPLVYEMLVGAGILAGGAVAANQMQKEIQTTIDKNPGVIDQALKNVFTGPASRLIDPNFLKEMQAKKPTPTNQGQTNWAGSFKKKAPATEEDIMKGSLFYEQSPSGIVLGPTVGGIEKGREEARSKPLITPMPVDQQDQTLATPVPEKTTVLPGMNPAPTPIQNEGFNMPTTPDTSILTKDIQPAKFEFPNEETRNKEVSLSKDLFELSQNNPTLDMYEQYKNNPVIQNKIESSKKAYKDTSATEGYGTGDYWTNRKFANDTIGYKDFIKKAYGEGAPKKNKEMFIVMGPSSSGKSTSLVDKLAPETGSYLADSDEIKKLLPEFTDGYNAGGVHKESSDINQRIMKIALARGDNIVYPTTGRDPAKLKKELERAEKYGYTPKVYIVTANREVLLLRNLARMLSSNRVVDSDLLLNEQLIKDINTTYENLPEKYKAGRYDTSKEKR